MWSMIPMESQHAANESLHQEDSSVKDNSTSMDQLCKMMTVSTISSRFPHLESLRRSLFSRHAGSEYMSFFDTTIFLKNTSNGHIKHCWKMGEFQSKVPTTKSNLKLDFDVSLRLDRNTKLNCIQLMFTGNCDHLFQSEDESQGVASKSKRPVSNISKLGYVLIELKEDSKFSFRGMLINPALRGFGLSKIFLAIWLQVCCLFQVSPTTNRIDKPLLSLVLKKFGFLPVNPKLRCFIAPPVLSNSNDAPRLTRLWSSKPRQLHSHFSKAVLKSQDLCIVAGPEEHESTLADEEKDSLRKLSSEIFVNTEFVCGIDDFKKLNQMVSQVVQCSLWEQPASVNLDEESPMQPVGVLTFTSWFRGSK